MTLRERLWKHLWTRHPAPPEYLDFKLRTRVYHAPPPPLPTLLRDLQCLDVEAKVRAARPPRPAPRPAPRRFAPRRRFRR